MTTPLCPAEQDLLIESTIALMLDNFSLAWHVADLLIEYAASSVPPPTATVLLQGSARCVEIPGENCGFFTTPVIQMAILDCRRSLEFFGLTCDSATRSLKAIEEHSHNKKRRHADDLGIEHFGLPWVTPDQLIGATNSVASVPLEPLLADIHQWSNKQLAHFTLLPVSITLEAIRDVSKAMIEAYGRLFFDALGRPRPRSKLMGH